MKKSINALDFESSGLNGYPIQVGIIKENGKTYESLIIPHEEWLTDLEWDYNAQVIHNLEKDFVISNGKNLTIVANELNNFLNGEDAFVDSVYDVSWMNLLFEFAEVKRTFHIFVLDKIMSEDFIIHWDAIFYKVHKSSNLKLHDALSDAKLIQRTFETIAKHF